MLRKIITIDKERCNGCGLCAEACKEGAIAVINGKAELVREDCCDGLGNCLPVCPQDAITVTEKEALPFIQPEQEKIMRKHKKHRVLNTKPKTPQKKEHHSHNDDGETLACGCSKNTVRSLKPTGTACSCKEKSDENGALSQWPVQIKLLPVNASFYQNSRLLIAADCTAYAYRNFHKDFIEGHITLVGCPKLDDIDYSKKLGEILKTNTVTEIVLTRMEVPCCGGMEQMVKNAIIASGETLPLTIYTISAEGHILKTENQ